MMPVLFSIGPYNVYTFGVLLAISFLCSTFLVWRYAREEFREEEYLDAYIATCVAALVGARLVYVMLHLSEFGLQILMYIVVRRAPGLSFLGGMVVALVFFWSYAKKKKLARSHVLDIFSIAASFAMVCAKIGQQLGGAGFGRPVDSFLSVRIVGLPGRYVPVELYESVIFLSLFFLVSFLYERRKRYHLESGTVALVFAYISIISLFFLEFLKSYTPYMWGLSARQYGCLLVLGLLTYPAIRMMMARKKKKGV